MTRTDAYKLIDTERDNQDKLWRVGRPTEAQYVFAAPHILLLGEKADTLRTLWYKSAKEDLQAEFVKIAALAIRALEEIES